MASEKTDITERLDLHNQSILVVRAKKKLTEGKVLSSQERTALENATNEKNRNIELPFMQRMPKHEYIERFGGSVQCYINWAEKWDFPWAKNSRHVDALETITWFRNHLASANKRAANNPSDHAGRLKKAQAEREELRLERERGEVVFASEIESDLRIYGNIISEAAEAIELINPDAYRVLIEAIEKANDTFSDNTEATEATGEDVGRVQPAGSSFDK